MSEFRKITLVVSLAVASVSSPALAQSQVPSREAGHTGIAVEGFLIERVPRLASGVPLNFSVFGTEHAAVSVYVEGVTGLVELLEVQPGVYEGSHVIDDDDSLRSDSQVVATMQRRGQVARATFGEPLVLAPVALPWGEARSTSPVEVTPMPAPARSERSGPAQAQAYPPRCVDCAVVESIRVVEAPKPDDLHGKLKRALEEHQRRVLGVLDAIGLPFAGRERERLVEHTMAFDVVLRFEDGRAVTRRYATRPGFGVGDTVTLPATGGRLAADS